MTDTVPKQDRAVALEYGQLDELPRITAAGVGEAARAILSLAKKHDVPIHKDEELARLLQETSPGKVIDSRTFRLVAELVSFLYNTDREWRAEHQFLKPVLGDGEVSEQITE